MQVFFDTNVLVAASERSHPHYVQAWPALRRVEAGKDKGFMSAHSIAEVYAALTRLPVQPRIHPAEALRIISDNILPHFEGRAHREKGLRRGAQGRRKWGMERSENLRRIAHGLCGQVRC